MCLLDLIQQNHAVGTLANRLGQHTAEAIADIAGWCTFQLRYGMRFLIFGKVNRDQARLAAKHQIGQCARGFRLADATRTDQQEYAQWSLLRRQPRLGGTQAFSQ